MRKNEFMTLLANQLHKRNIADAAEIMGEYEQHFAFRLADGYSEEEIAARLGDPAALAAQFGESEAPAQRGGNRILVAAGLGIADLFAGLFFLLLSAWGLVMAAASLAGAALTVCLLGGLNLYSLIPPMPYWCGAILALSFGALSVLLAVGCVYFAAFLRQLIRSFGRFQRNALASASGRAVLPPLPVSPQFSARAIRRLRSVALVALALFAACFVLAYIVCSLSAGSLEFWHIWGWFGHSGLH